MDHWARLRTFAVSSVGLVRSHFPVGVACALGLLLVSRLGAPDYVDYDFLPNGTLTEAQEHTISMVEEMNKYLISVATLLFTALGFYVARFGTSMPRSSLLITLFLIIAMLAATYYFAFRTYEQLTGALAQDALALRPASSRTLYYLELEFWGCLTASISMFTLFVSGVFGPSARSADHGG